MQMFVKNVFILIFFFIDVFLLFDLIQCLVPMLLTSFNYISIFRLFSCSHDPMFQNSLEMNVRLQRSNR
jgi:hypothetical protein